MTVFLVHYAYRRAGQSTDFQDRRDPAVAVFSKKGNAWRWINEEQPKLDELFNRVGTGTAWYWIEEMEVQDEAEEG